MAGIAAGAALAAWEQILGRDVDHGMLWLAAERLARAAFTGAAGGMVLSGGLALLLAALARGGARFTRLGVRALVLLAAACAVAAVGPWRDKAFPLHPFSSKPLSVAVALVALGAGAWLVVLRCGDALGRTPRPRRSGAAGVLGLAALAVAATSCLLLPLAAATRSTGRLCVILVSLDTLRADRLGVMGYHRRLTPRLDALAAEGMVFEQAMAAAPWTLPSHASLFTSLLPSDHAARRDYTAIAPVQTVLAEHFRNAGYRTGAFTGGGYVSAKYGFAQGFEVYDDHDENREGGPVKITQAALKWVRSIRGQSFFLFVHTYEPHAPFIHADFADPGEAGRLAAGLSGEQVQDIHHGRLVLTGPERRYVTDLYDGDAALADRAIGDLLETLKEEGVLDRALCIILSDHGEDLWDHELGISPAHGHSLYQDVLHVPLLVRAPGLVPAGARIRTPVTLLDVAPTILAMAGLPADPNHQGADLARTFREGEEPESRLMLFESVQFGPDRFALREGDLKVILTPTPKVVNNDVPLEVRALEVFDLATDPLERNDLSGRMDDRERRMMRILWSRVQRRHKPFQGGEEGKKIPEELREQLRSLGYLN